MPSPLVDAFAGTTSELKKLRAQKAAESLVNESFTSLDQRKKCGKQNKAKQSNLSTGDDSAKQPMDGGSSLEAIMLRLSALEMKISDQGHEITSLNTKMASLHTGIIGLEKGNADLRSGLITTMHAMNGNKLAINKIRQCILLDFARDELAILCGFQD